MGNNGEDIDEIVEEIGKRDKIGFLIWVHQLIIDARYEGKDSIFHSKEFICKNKNRN